jgi:hypothetical protein
MMRNAYRIYAVHIYGVAIMIFGIDDGNYNCKAFGRSGQEDTMSAVPSLVRKGLSRNRSAIDVSGLNGAGYDSSTFIIDGSVYSTGDVKNDSKRSHDREYGASAENLAVVHNVLHKAGMSGQDVNIMTGLPFKYYYTPSGDVNKELVDRKKQMFSNPVEDHDGGRAPVHILKHNIMAQGEAAYFDLLIDIEYQRQSGGLKIIGKPNSEIMNSNVLILDIGGGTTDPVFIKKGGVIDHSRSGTFEYAGYKMISDMEDMVKSSFGITSELGRDKYQQAIITGELAINAKRIVDVREIRDELVEQNFDTIYEKMVAIVQGVEDVDIVAPVGGSTLFFAEAIKRRMKDNYIIDVVLPIYANPRGMFKRLYLASNAKK